MRLLQVNTLYELKVTHCKYSQTSVPGTRMGRTDLKVPSIFLIFLSKSIGPWGRLFSAFWPIRKIFISLFGLEEDYYQLIIGSLSKKKPYIHFLISCDILQLVEEVFLYHVILYWLRRFLSTKIISHDIRKPPQPR
jgi:hypothetical protein